MKIQTSHSDILWNYLSVFFSVGVQVIWLPMLLHFLSADDLGVWYIFASMGGIVALFDFGFTPQMSRAVTYAWSGAEKLLKFGTVRTEENRPTNYALLGTVFRSCRVLYLFVALLAAVALFLFGTWYLWDILADFSLERQISWAIYVLSTVLNLYIGWYLVALRGVGGVKECGKAITIAKGIQFVLGSFLLWQGLGLVGLALTTLISSMTQRGLAKYFLVHRYGLFRDFLRKYRDARYSVRETLTTLWPNAWRDGLVTISFMLTNQATVLLAGKCLSLAETGIYSVSVQILNVLFGIAGSLTSSYGPAMVSAFATRNLASVREMVGRGVATFYWISIGGALLFVTIGVPILQFFRESFQIDRLVFLLLAFHMFLLGRHRSSGGIIVMTNQLPYTKAFILSAVFGFLLSAFFTGYCGWGIYGLILGPLFVQSLYNNWYWNHYVAKRLGTTEFGFVRDGTKFWIRKIRSASLRKG